MILCKRLERFEGRAEIINAVNQHIILFYFLLCKYSSSYLQFQAVVCIGTSNLPQGHAPAPHPAPHPMTLVTQPKVCMQTLLKQSRLLAAKLGLFCLGFKLPRQAKEPCKSVRVTKQLNSYTAHGILLLSWGGRRGEKGCLAFKAKRDLTLKALILTLKALP